MSNFWRDEQHQADEVQRNKDASIEKRIADRMLPSDEQAAALRLAGTYNKSVHSPHHAAEGCPCDLCADLADLILEQRRAAVAEDRAKVSGDAMEAAWTWLHEHYPQFPSRYQTPSAAGKYTLECLASLLTRFAQAAVEKTATECAQIADGACPTFVLKGSLHKAALIRDAICQRFKLGEVQSDAGALVSQIIGRKGNTHVPDDWITTGWSRQPQIGTTTPGRWLEMGHSASVVSDPPPMPPELPAHWVADKLNELEDEIRRLRQICKDAGLDTGPVATTPKPV